MVGTFVNLMIVQFCSVCCFCLFVSLLLNLPCMFCKEEIVMACLWTAPNMHYDGIGLNTASALDTLWFSNAVHMFTHPVSRSQQTSFFLTCSDLNIKHA